MKKILFIPLFFAAIFSHAQGNAACYNSGAITSSTEETVEVAARDTLQASLVLMPYVMNEKEVMLILKEKKNPSINRLLRTLKLSNDLKPIGFIAIPAGILGALSFVNINTSDKNTNDIHAANQNLGLGFFALGTVCLSSGIYFNITQKKNYKKAIQKYNQLYN
jgi:hypothetical protein